MSWWLLPLVAFAQEEVAEDFRGHLDQARFFVRRSWYEDAERELEAAVRHPDGRYDPEAWYLLATVRYELLDVEGAREAGARAHTYSRTDDQLQSAAGFSAFVHEQFGLVEVRAPHAGLTGRLDIELTGLLFDPNLKSYLEKLQDQQRGRHLLPVRFGLPVGTYTINGQEVEVGAEALTVVDLPSGRLGTGPTLTRLLEAEVALGFSTWVGPAASNLLPGFTGQVAVDLPVGPVRAGLMFDWAPRAYTMIDGQTDLNPAGGSLGARVGVEVPGTDPLTVRLSAGYRYAFVPGLELTCAANGTSYDCGPDAEADLVLYAVGRAHVPLLELAVHSLAPSRSSGVGFGIKGIVERAFGSFPGEGAATVLTNGEPMVFKTDPAESTWQATGLRVMANLSLSF